MKRLGAKLRTTLEDPRAHRSAAVALVALGAAALRWLLEDHGRRLDELELELTVRPDMGDLIRDRARLEELRRRLDASQGPASAPEGEATPVADPGGPGGPTAP